MENDFHITVAHAADRTATHRNQALLPADRPKHDHGFESIHPDDELLCAWARQGCRRSRHLLWERHRRNVACVVHVTNRRHFLPAWEMEDAMQQAYLAFHHAVDRYDPMRSSGAGRASFRTFLGIVVANEFSKYCARQRTRRRHETAVDGDLDTMVTGADAAARRLSGMRPGSIPSDDLDWHSFLTFSIASEPLATALSTLNRRERELIELWLTWGRDRDVGRLLAISPTAARLRRERLFRRIGERVGRRGSRAT